MEKKSTPIMYSNVLFKFNSPFEIEKEEMFASILLTNGETYKVKIVASSEVGLRGVPKDVLDKEIQDFSDKKFNQFKAKLTSSEEDALYEVIEAEESTKGKKYSKKESNNRYSELEKKALEDKVETFKKQYLEDLLNGKVLLQANAIFLNHDTKTGLLQIPATTTIASSSNQKRNMHVVNDMILNITASTYDSEYKRETLTFEKLKDVTDNVGIFSKFDVMNEAIYFEYLYQINSYLLNKLETKGIFANGAIFDPDLNNLLYIKSLIADETTLVEPSILANTLIRLDTWLNKFKTAGANLDNFAKEEITDSKGTGWLVKPTKEDMEEIRNVYEIIKNEVIKDNKIVISSKEYEIFVNVYFEPKKRLEFVKSLQTSLKDTKTSSLIILGKKDKKDYLALMDKIEIEDIGISLKFAYEKEKDDNCNYVLSSFYHFPVTERPKTVQRIFGYSFSDNTYIPNYKSPSHSGGYILSLKTQDFLKGL